MKKQEKLYRSLALVAVLTGLILLVPFVAMQYSSEVAWSATDFVIMGALLSGTGLAYVLISRSATGRVYRVAAGLALGTTLMLIWANLAVGLIGGGPNAANLMYMAVVPVVIAGVIRYGLRAGAMERTMYAASLTLMVLMGVALITGMYRYPGSSAVEVLGVSGLFAGLYAASGLLFRYAARGILPGAVQ